MFIFLLGRFRNLSRLIPASLSMVRISPGLMSFAECTVITIRVFLLSIQ